MGPMAYFPDPDGRQPDGWPDDQWAAWKLLHAGRSRRDVARALDRPVGTIGRWVIRWRDWYGQDLLRDQAAVNRRRGVPPLREAPPPPEWVGPLSQLEAAGQLDSLGDLARVVLLRMLTAILDDPERIAAASIHDVRYLAQAHQRLVDDEPHPPGARPGRSRPGSDGGRAGGAQR